MTERLVELGADVVALVRDQVGRSHLLSSPTAKEITIVSGALEDYFTIERALNEYEIETVLHLGAQTIVGTANRSPLGTFTSNIEGTWNVLEAARRSPLVKRIVVASSDKAYGDQPELPYLENARLEGRHPYDVSKSCADLICTSYHHTYGLPVCITRCGNLFGGGDLNFNRIIPGNILSALKGEAPVIRSDGSFTRDYFYVRDAVDAYLHLAEQMDREEVRGQAFNFSNERPMTVLEITDMVLEVMGKKDLKPNVLGEAKNEIQHQYLSAQKARDLLEWTPAWSPEKGLGETVEWYRQWAKDARLI
ncbi:MAG: GDP-mannose 4,6-dehydratase [Chrysiogenetes bacterium]|nr:GDP-mannose 4,6-dehydratase [Chrysiogenetes bacterium]